MLASYEVPTRPERLVKSGYEFMYRESHFSHHDNNDYDLSPTEVECLLMKQTWPCSAACLLVEVTRPLSPPPTRNDLQTSTRQEIKRFRIYRRPKFPHELRFAFQRPKRVYCHDGDFVLRRVTSAFLSGNLLDQVNFSVSRGKLSSLRRPWLSTRMTADIWKRGTTFNIPDVTFCD